MTPLVLNCMQCNDILDASHFKRRKRDNLSDPPLVSDGDFRVSKLRLSSSSSFASLQLSSPLVCCSNVMCVIGDRLLFQCLEFPAMASLLSLLMMVLVKLVLLSWLKMIYVVIFNVDSSSSTGTVMVVDVVRVDALPFVSSIDFSIWYALPPNFLIQTCMRKIPS